MFDLHFDSNFNTFKLFVIYNNRTLFRNVNAIIKSSQIDFQKGKYGYGTMTKRDYNKL